MCCLSPSVKSLKVLSPNRTRQCEQPGQDFLAVGLWHSFAQARSRWASRRSESNVFSQTCFLSDELVLAGQEFRAVDEVGPLSIGLFQWVSARGQSPIAGRGASQDTAPEVSRMCQNITDSTASSVCSSCLFRWQWTIGAESVPLERTFGCLEI